MRKSILILATAISFSATSGGLDGHKLMDLLEEQEVSPTGYSSGYFDGYVSGIAEISVFTFWSLMPFGPRFHVKTTKSSKPKVPAL